jgi:hypothetical protein
MSAYGQQAAGPFLPGKNSAHTSPHLTELSPGIAHPAFLGPPVAPGTVPPPQFLGPPIHPGVVPLHPQIQKDQRMTFHGRLQLLHRLLHHAAQQQSAYQPAAYQNPYLPGQPAPLDIPGQPYPY